MTHEFEFEFANIKQFYAIVHLLNKECGKGKWTIKGKVLKSLKQLERYTMYATSRPTVKKTVVIPAEMVYVEAMIRFVHTNEKVSL
jgi:hypothetical protein|tara:strand:- start:5225 stop:5482 length:258 start_codon:yes stop_codon:yes gene_type:complete